MRLELDSGLTVQEPAGRAALSGGDLEGGTATGAEMEYYYCPRLLKLLRYLWVSGPVAFLSFVCCHRPAALCGSAPCALGLGDCHREEEAAEGSVWEGSRSVGRASSPETARPSHPGDPESRYQAALLPCPGKQAKRERFRGAFLM